MIARRFHCPIQKWALKTPNHPAIISKNKIFSYQDFDQAVTAMAERLRKLNVRLRERVAIVASNSVEEIILLFALWRIQAVPCLFSPRLVKTTLKKYIRQLKCRCLNLNNLNKPRRFVWTKQTYEVCLRFNQPADIIFTSGTTGEPKAAVHTLGNHYFSAKGANAHIPFSSNDRWLLSLPLYHVGGLGILFRVFLAGGSLVIPSTEQSLEQSLKRYQITHVSCVSTQLYRLLNFRSFVWKEYLKAVLVGGGPVPKILIEKAVQKKMPIYTTYGLTEMSSQVATSQRLSDKDCGPRATILKYRQVKIAPDGEILVKGKTLFQGYLKANKIQKIRGWFKTGDLGRFDKKGLVVLGRKDDMFISGGENIQPAEIEVYLKQHKDIKEAVVISKAHREFGSRPIAFVKTWKNKPLKPQQLKSHLAKHLPKFKIPDQFYKLKT